MLGVPPGDRGNHACQLLIWANKEKQITTKFLAGLGKMLWGAKYAQTVSVFGVGKCTILTVI